HSGTTYIALESALRRDRNGLKVSVSGHADNSNFGTTLTVFGGAAELGPDTTFFLHDNNTPATDSGCPSDSEVSTLEPLHNGGFTSLVSIFNVGYDEFTGHQLVLEGNSIGLGFPFLSNVSEALLDNPNDLSQYFTNGNQGCKVLPQIFFNSVLPFFGQHVNNGFSPLVSS